MSFEKLAKIHGITRHQVEKIANTMMDDLRKHINSIEPGNRVQAAENPY